MDYTYEQKCEMLIAAVDDLLLDRVFPTTSMLLQTEGKEWAISFLAQLSMDIDAIAEDLGMADELTAKRIFVQANMAKYDAEQ